LDFHLPAVSVKRAGQNIHEGTLAGAVLPNQSVNFSLIKIETDPVECNGGSEPLLDAAK